LTFRDAFGADNTVYADLCPSGLGDEHHIMPHKLAHAFSLLRAPCGTAQDTDSWFGANGAPDGRTLSDGWDSSNNSVPDGSKQKDVMSYCSSYWVGAYDRGKVIAFFQSGPTPSVARTAALSTREATRALPNDVLTVDESASFDTRRGLRVYPYGFTEFGDAGPIFGRTAPGSDALFEGLDARGQTLFSDKTVAVPVESQLARRNQEASMAMDHVIDGSEQRALAAIRVTYRGHVAILHGLPGGPIKGTATAIDAKHVRVGFDAKHYTALDVTDSGGKKTRSSSIPARAPWKRQNATYTST